MESAWDGNPISVECPMCKAAVGVCCTGPGGYHDARIVSFEFRNKALLVDPIRTDGPCHLSVWDAMWHQHCALQELIEEASDHISTPVEMAQALIVESVEVLNELPWKGWKVNPPIDINRLGLELADVLHFLFEVARKAGITHDELASYYFGKNIENRRRAEARRKN